MEIKAITSAEFKQRISKASEHSKKLVSANIEMTTLCNFTCPHCYLQGKNGYCIDPLFYKRMIRELKALGCIYLTLTGGEAILHPQFDELYNYARAKGFIISLFSNGYELDDKINLFKNSKPYEIDITLYGVDEMSYRNNTGRQDGKRVLDNIDLLFSNGIPFSLKCACTKEMKPLIADMQKIANHYGATFRLDPYIFAPEGSKSASTRMEPEDIASLICSNHALVDSIRDSLTRQKTTRSYYTCNPCENNIYISSDERALICPFTSHVHSFNLSESTLSAARTYFSSFHSLPISQSSSCGKCKFYSFCKYCPERFFLETGCFDTPPAWLCEVARLVYSKIGGYNE